MASQLKQGFISQEAFAVDNSEEKEFWEKPVMDRGWEGGKSWEERLDQLLADADDEDTEDRWEELARRISENFEQIKLSSVKYKPRP